MDRISERLNTLVEELAEGNGAKFAQNAGIKQATFYNYMNGRQPNVEALSNICKNYSINLNWLVCGKGDKYMDFKKNGSCEFWGIVGEWVSELKKNDPKNEIWFEVQFKKLFPEFKDWELRRSSEDGSHNPIPKVA
jgi:hypothetical protein